MVKNARLVLCTVMNLGACAAVAALVMFGISRNVVVSTLAPSMMLAISLAMYVV